MWFFFALACTPPEPEPVEPDDTGRPTLRDTSTFTDTGTTTTGDTGRGWFVTPTGDTADTGVVGCATLPTAPLSLTALSGYPGSEEFDFSADGYLVNVSDTYDAVMRVPFGGPIELVAPYDAIEIAGVRFLPDGDIVVADEWEGAAVRQSLDGPRSLLAGGLVSPNSLAVRSTGDVYAGGYGEIVRVHPDGTIERIFEIPNTDFDGLVLSPDEMTLWLNHDDGGVVGQLHLDASGAVVSFGQVTTLAGSLNGATVDACGNYYVITVAGVLWRISPSGGSQRFADLSQAGAFTTSAVRFGSGVGGWESDHVYVMDRSTETLFALDVGVERGPLPHIP
jgi:hypothetical protein